jgi:hypothetical protein
VIKLWTVDDGGRLFLEVGKTPPCNIIVGEEHWVSYQSVNVTSSDILIFIYVFIIGWIILILEYMIDFMIPWECSLPSKKLVSITVIESRMDNRCRPSSFQVLSFLVLHVGHLVTWVHCYTRRPKLVYLPTGYIKH